MALLTLSAATSPRLSVILLDFSRSHIVRRPIETLIQETTYDLQWIASEISRIEREFKGAVTLSTHRDSAFEEVLDTLNVSFRSVEWMITSRSY